MATIFTLGYQKRTLQEFVGLLLESSIDVLVDVRETAWSHKPGFSKGALSTALKAAGIEYVHAKFAGNPKELRRRASSHAACLQAYERYVSKALSVVDSFDQLVAPLIRADKRVCLMCFERHHEDCHRSILADKWRARGKRRVQHLAFQGCERLIVTS